MEFHKNILKIRNKEGKFREGDGVVIMARPENLSISRKEKSNCLRGEIEDKIFMGSYTRYRIQMCTDDLVLVDVPEAINKTFNIGEKVNVRFRRKKLLVYHQPEEGLKEVLSLE